MPLYGVQGAKPLETSGFLAKFSSITLKNLEFLLKDLEYGGNLKILGIHMTPKNTSDLRPPKGVKNPSDGQY